MSAARVAEFHTVRAERVFAAARVESCFRLQSLGFIGYRLAVTASAAGTNPFSAGSTAVLTSALDKIRLCEIKKPAVRAAQVIYIFLILTVKAFVFWHISTMRRYKRQQYTRRIYIVYDIDLDFYKNFSIFVIK